jgi:hypothetical protein
VHQQRGCRGIADAHLSKDDGVGARHRHMLKRLLAPTQSVMAFRGGQRSLFDEVARAAADLGLDEMRMMAAVPVHARIYNP